MRIVAIVPARSGSKGLPGKNIKPLLGKPLIAHAIEPAVRCADIDAVFINSDSQDYLEIGQQYGAKPFLRPRELAGDECSIMDVISHFVKGLEEMGEHYDAVMLLYAVYPLRTTRDLQGIIDTFKSHGGERSLVGIMPPKSHPYKCYTMGGNGNIESIMGIDENDYYRRQQYPTCYELSLWASIMPIATLGEHNAQCISRTTLGYPIPDHIPDLDIDTNEDFKYAARMMGASPDSPHRASDQGIAFES